MISDTDDANAQVTASEATICAHVENLKRTTNKVERCLEERQHLLGTKKKILDTKRQLSKNLVDIEDQYQKAMDELESVLTQQNEEKKLEETRKHHHNLTAALDKQKEKKSAEVDKVLAAVASTSKNITSVTQSSLLSPRAYGKDLAVKKRRWCAVRD